MGELSEQEFGPSPQAQGQFNRSTAVSATASSHPPDTQDVITGMEAVVKDIW